jgi:ubiquinone/menaquinone biosynthesis C-methylase UbiE
MTDSAGSEIARYWNGRAVDFDDEGLHTPATADELAAWARIAALLDGSAGPLDVLDAGCGTGFLALLFAERGHRVTGSDLAPAMIEQARAKAVARNLAARFEVGDVELLKYPNESFDLVISRHLFWTLPHPAAALREWVRVTRAPGRVAVLDGRWVPQGRTANAAGSTQRAYERAVAALPFNGGAPAGEVARLMQEAGLADVCIDPLTDLVEAERRRVETAGRPTGVTERYLVRGCRPA